MKYARVKAVNLKVGDVIAGKRINTTPFVHKSKRQGDTVHFFLSNHGRVEPVKLGASEEVAVKRPIYNLTKKPRRKVRVKEATPVAQTIVPVAEAALDSPIEAAISRAELMAGCG
jgi:hypothetical protein